MTDAATDPSRFLDTDDELVFDDDAPAVADAADAAVPDVMPAKRRAPRKGSRAPVAEAAADAEIEASATPDAAIAAEPADARGSIPRPEDAPAGSIPSPSALRRFALPAIVGCAMLSSLVSVGGLIAVGHTLADLRVEQAHVADERATLARVPALVASLDRAAAALAAASAPRPAPANGAVTAADLRHGLDDLRLALADRQPQGVSALANEQRSSFAEIATRLDRLEQARRPAAAR